MNHYKEWPRLDFNEWKDTFYTVHLWTQIVGKIRLRNSPWLNHSWHVTLYVSPKGLTTGSIPYSDGLFQINFDFVHHQLIIQTDKEGNTIIPLYSRTVASFYKEVMQDLLAAGIETTIHAIPNEVDPAIPFEKDEVHKSYDAEQINSFWRALVKVHTVFTGFRSRFRGKCSPVHFFWGSFDLAVTRFSGRTAPLHPGGAPNVPVEVMQEAYSHELSSCGFWPGNEQFPQAVFYAYCYPSIADFSKQPVAPAEAYFHEQMGEFILPYEAVRQLSDPENMLLQFMQTTYEAAANTLDWDREGLECDLSSLEHLSGCTKEMKKKT
jgi:hypothetical protein